MIKLKELNIVADKEYEGRTLPQYIEEQGEEALGTKYSLDKENVHTQIMSIEEEAEFVVDETSFHALFVLEGSSHMLSSRKKMTLNKGNIIFLPAGYGTYCIVGTCKVIFMTIA